MYEYLYVETEGFPVGTVLERIEPTSAHHQARAMVKEPVVPKAVFRVLGTDEVLTLNAFEGMYGSVHPKSPEVMGPFAPGKVIVDRDRLPSNCWARVALVPNYPVMNAVIVVNTDPVDNSLAVYSNHVEFEKVCFPSLLSQRIQAKLKELSENKE